MSASTSHESNLDESYHLEKSSKHDGDLSDDICNTFENKDYAHYSDVTFIVDGKKLHYHKVILASRSTYFDAMFKSRLTESSIIEIKTMPCHIFEEIVRFLYTGSIRIHDEDVTQLTEMADMMELEPLKDTLAEHCQKKFQPANCLDYYSMALKYKAEKLKLLSMGYAAEEFENVKKTENFKNQPCEIILDYLENHEIKTYSEDEICTAAIDWMLHSPKERIPQLYDIMKVMRIENLSPNYTRHYIHGLLCNQPSVISQDDEGLTKDFRSALLNICFLTTNYTKINYQFPRTGTTVVTGFITFPGSQTNTVELYKYGSKNSLSCKINDHGKNNSISNLRSLVTFQNNIFGLSPPTYYYHNRNNETKLYIYDSRTNSLSTAAVPSSSQVLVCNDEKLYALSVHNNNDTFVITISEYNKYNYSKWIVVFKSTGLKRYNAEIQNPYKVTMNNKKIYIWGVHNVMDQTSTKQICNRIMVIDVATKQQKVLNITLPQEVSHMQVIEYKTNVLIVGTDKIWKCDMSVLEKDFEKQEPFTEDDSQAISEIFQFTSKREGFHMVRVGNMLLLLGGKTTDEERWKNNENIFNVNIDELIACRKDLEWTEVGKLNNQSIAGVAPLTFDAT